jgi:Tfp pilus assembly protein PilF
MARTDRRGLPLSTASDLAAERYRDGVDLLLSAWPGAAEALEEATAADPDFALAHAARARLHAIRAEPTEARTRIAAAAEIASRHGTEHTGLS